MEELAAFVGVNTFWIGQLTGLLISFVALHRAAIYLVNKITAPLKEEITSVKETVGKLNETCESLQKTVTILSGVAAGKSPKQVVQDLLAKIK